jgi:hypothetical protein
MKRMLAVLAVAIGATSLSAQGVRITLPPWTEPVLLDSMRQEHPISAAPADVYQAVLKAYTALSIPPGKTSGEAGIIGSEKFERMHNLASAPMSMSFSCGESATGPSADSYRLTIAIVTWVKPAKDGKTTLAVASIASASSVEGARRTPRECSSTGRIETKIVDQVKKVLGIG